MKLTKSTKIRLGNLISSIPIGLIFWFSLLIIGIFIVDDAFAQEKIPTLSIDLSESDDPSSVVPAIKINV